MPREDKAHSRRQILKYGSVLTTAGMTSMTGCLTDDGGDGGDFPSDDFRYIVPFSEGGGTDTYARAIAPSLSEASGQDVTVDNIPGAASLRGTEEAYQAEDSGHSFIGFNPPATNTSWLIHQPDWDITDMSGVAYIGRTAYVLIANSDQNVEDLSDLQSRYESGEFTAFGGQEPGHLYHIAALLFRDQLDIPWQEYVAYPGTGPIVQSVISGEVPVGIATDTGALSAVEEGRADVVAVMHSDGSTVFPDAPTIGDQGFEGIDYAGGIYRGIYAPPSTSDERVNALSGLFEEAVQSDEMQEWSEETGNDVSYGGPSEANDILAETTELIRDKVDIESVREETE